MTSNTKTQDLAAWFAGLVGYWTFDEAGAGGAAPDQSGRGNHGQLHRGQALDPLIAT